MIGFKDNYEIRPYRNRDGSLVYLIDDELKQNFVDWWGFGWLNVNGVVSIEDGFSYIAKYCIKIAFDRDVPKHRLGLALMWVFGKRSFSISRGIIDLIKGLKVNSNFRLVGISDFRGFYWNISLDEIRKVDWVVDNEFVRYLVSKGLYKQLKLC